MKKQAYLQFDDVWLTINTAPAKSTCETSDVEPEQSLDDGIDDPEVIKELNDAESDKDMAEANDVPEEFNPSEEKIKSLEELVKIYCGNYPGRIAFLDSLIYLYSLQDCVTGAHNGQLEDKILKGQPIHKHGHLFRYTNDTLLQMAKRLDYDNFNFPFTSFEDLYHKVKCTAGREPQVPSNAPIVGFGLVGLYDTAIRIGYHIIRNPKEQDPQKIKRIMPERYVYVHQGSLRGFKTLLAKGLINKKYLPEQKNYFRVDKKCFPKELKVLTAFDIENFLCCMENQLKHI